MSDIQKKIENMINANDIVLFMKGTASIPMCGFSGTAVAILNRLNVKFLDVDVLSDDDIRSGIKTYSEWPTIPQLYIKQQFIGGSDIMKIMYENGELELLLKKHLLI
ncbi:Grx4 family monothiol glutaredoxin [Candidatus Fokinia crypta]|uniref:Glutaredoxin n=1 Tax=Candidatus Fokinia crypta TaxID=1920990 RepID=A0ABZ0USK9_9RICK|nr:Grx4 family monothiol glutaredoxin [Candidatus Fokinia cryptica]WPX97678.1 Glutaredoxin-4 [Candidatus Fokinia cryptica]